jgi:BlaR1 peptidase M56/PDZ domain
MSDALLATARWLLHISLCGSCLLLLTWLVVRRVSRPALQQRVAEWGVTAAILLAGLCLTPAWLTLSLPVLPVAGQVSPAPEPEAQQPADERAATTTPQPEAAPETMPAPGNDPVAVLPAEELPVVPPKARVAPPQTPIRPDPEVSAEPTRSFQGIELLTMGVLGAYLLGVMWFLGRLAWGHWCLARCLRGAMPAPAEVWGVLEEMVPGPNRLRVLISARARVPLSCGLWRPTIVLPPSLCESGAGSRLHWALAHEMAHLRRRDALTCLLFGLAQAVYYFVPWLWLLRRQVRLCQEYVADAAAVAETGPAEDYAEFLLEWSVAPALPAGATGVSGQSSDLFRRITMLIKNPQKIEERCSRRWSLLAAAGLLSLAIVGAGVSLKAVAAPADKKDETRKDVTKDKNATRDKAEDRKAEPKKENRLRLRDNFPDIEDLMKRLPQGLSEDQAKLFREQFEQMHKMMQQMHEGFPGARLPGGVMPFPQFPQFQGRLARQGEVRLGVRVQKPSETLAEQLDLPQNQGLIIEDVQDNSAADKAGLKKHDILLEMAGKPVPSDPQAFVQMLKDIKPDTKVDAVVMRKSRRETIKGLTLPKVKEVRKPAFNFPNFRFGQNNVLPGFAPGEANGATTLTRNNDSFTAKHQHAGLTIAVTGTVKGNKATAKEIKITDNGKTSTYKSLDKVPAEHREKVKELIGLAGKGTARAAVPEL